MKAVKTYEHFTHSAVVQYQLIHVQLLGFTAECSDHGCYDSDKAILS